MLKVFLFTVATWSAGAPAYRLRKAEARAHIVVGLIKALDTSKRASRCARSRIP
jgi:DNA gyrase/topoisomerase IV subunit A